MPTAHQTSPELRIAEEIMSVLPAGSWMRVCSDDRDVVRYAVRAAGLKLSSVVFSRSSLAKLAGDATRVVKIDYLQRDIARTAERRNEFRYPRTIRVKSASRRRRSVLNPLAAMVSVI